MAVIRNTMAKLFITLRGLTNAGTDDYTIGAVTYWNDSLLQSILDRYVIIIRDEQLKAIPAMYPDGKFSYFDYQSKSRFFEETSGGTATFVIRDATGVVIPSTSWSADYERGLITFTADTEGVDYYLTGRSYDIYAAAADIWYQKAAHASEQIDFTTDNHSIKRSHIVASCLAMARRYENLASVAVATSPVELVRGDMR